jgi:hypothetical protein
MLQETEKRDISYHEFRVIARLLRAHADIHGPRLRAMVVFGELVTTGSTFDIELLEIVEGWDGEALWVFDSSADLPMRGRTFLYFLKPEEFEQPDAIPEPTHREWVKALLERVREGYQVVMENKSGWVRHALDGPQEVSAATPPPTGMVEHGDPLTLAHSGR